MCDLTTKIIIDHISGTEKGDELKGCYFQWVSEDGGFSVYNFFAKDDQLIIPGVRVGSRFEFVLPYIQGTVWALTMSAGSCTYMGGQWLDNKSLNMPEPDQSYQAQAGGTLANKTIADQTIAVAAIA